MPSDTAPSPPPPTSPARLLALTARIVSAHVGRNPVTAEQVPELIRGVHRALGGLGQSGGAAPAEPARQPEPAVPIRRSVAHDRITCLECGARMAMLRRHLATAHQLTPEAYRERWGLGRDYPLVAPDYAEVRSGLAKRAGLGRRGSGAWQAGADRDAEAGPLATAEGTAPAVHAALDTAAVTEPPVGIVDAEPAPPLPKTRRGRKRGSPLASALEASRPGTEARRANATEDAPPAKGGRGRRRAAARDTGEAG